MPAVAKMSQTDAVAQEEVQHPYVRVVDAPFPISSVVERVVEVIGIEQLKIALLSDPSLQSHLDGGSDADTCCQLFFEWYFLRFNGLDPEAIGNQNKAQGRSSTLAAFIPEGAFRVQAKVEQVNSDGDCLFGALSTPAAKNDLRREIVAWERDHHGDDIGLPSLHDTAGLLMASVQDHAHAAYPSLSFPDYCAVMELPVREGGIWGESLEAAVFVKLRLTHLNVYVCDPSSTIRQQYARIWRLEAASGEVAEEKTCCGRACISIDSSTSCRVKHMGHPAAPNPQRHSYRNQPHRCSKPRPRCQLTP